MASAQQPQQQTETTEGDEAECIICLNKLSDDCCAIPCGHIADTACITAWLNVKKKCPLCNVPTTKNKIIRLYVKPRSTIDIGKLTDECRRLKDRLDAETKRANDMTDLADEMKRRAELNKGLYLELTQKTKTKKKKETRCTLFHPYCWSRPRDQSSGDSAPKRNMFRPRDQSSDDSSLKSWFDDPKSRLATLAQALKLI